MCSQADACNPEEFDFLLVSFAFRSDTVLSETWMVLCLPFVGPEQTDLKTVAIFALWRLIRRLLHCVRACLGGHTNIVV